MDNIDQKNWTDARSLTTSPERLRELYHVAPKVHSSIVNNPNTPTDILQALAREGDESVRFFVARNQSTPTDTLEILAHDGAQYAGKYIRGNVGLNPITPHPILELLAQDVECTVRSDVAENPNLSIDLLRTLAQDESSIVRAGAARNRNAPVELLRILSSDECEYVRDNIAKNPITSADILENLARNRCYRIRTTVAGNPNTSASTITWLFSNISEFRFLAKKDMENNALYFDPEIHEEVYENFVLAIAQNPNTPHNILQSLSHNSSPILGTALRNCIQQNPGWQAKSDANSFNQTISKATPIPKTAPMPKATQIHNTTSMIFYGQNDQQIKFILNEKICGEISSWNQQHLTSQVGQCILPTFQLTLLKDESGAMCIEVEQLHPKSLEGKKFKQIFAAQAVDSEILNISFRFFYLNPPNYELPSVAPFTLDLAKHFHIINGWQDWTAETALSGRYIYVFGEVDGDFSMDEDGWIEDTVTGEFIALVDPIPMALSE
jgi:hypothetical protein